MNFINKVIMTIDREAPGSNLQQATHMPGAVVTVTVRDIGKGTLEYVIKALEPIAESENMHAEFFHSNEQATLFALFTRK